VIRILKWVSLVPLAVFGIVARTVALKGFEPFKALGALIIAVLLAVFRLLLPDPCSLVLG